MIRSLIPSPADVLTIARSLFDRAAPQPVWAAVGVAAELIDAPSSAEIEAANTLQTILDTVSVSPEFAIELGVRVLERAEGERIAALEAELRDDRAYRDWLRELDADGITLHDAVTRYDGDRDEIDQDAMFAWLRADQSRWLGPQGRVAD